MIWQLIFAIAWLQVVLALKLFFNLRLWFRREIKGTGTKTVVHWKEWILMAAACSPSIYLLQQHIEIVIPINLFGWHFVLDWQLRWLIAAGICAFYLWIMIDGLYNKFRGFHWGFTGSVDPDDAKTDITLRRLPPVLQQLVKWLPFVILIYLFVKNFTWNYY